MCARRPPTMLRLNRRQRTVMSETLRQLANIVLGGTVIAQVAGSQPRSAWVAGGGIGTWWVLLMVAIVFAGGEERD
jgi:predicted branched-subunit amino acid permease